MDWRLKLCFTAFVVASAAIDEIQGATMVTGTVFCDQCKDGFISLLDYPLHGVNVTLTCVDGDGKITMQREETTNWIGTYTMKFDDTPDLSSCYAQVLASNDEGSNSCGSVGGPAKSLRLIFGLFGMALYSVDPLISQPAQPMSFCLSPYTPPAMPVAPVTPPPAIPAPPPSKSIPFLEGSACPFWNWTMPEYHCYWRVVSPDMKVAVVFGLIAARKYGTDMTLREGLQGKGDPHAALLREATTALLNSFNTLLFIYHPLGIIADFNSALLGTTSHVLHTALRFKRANSGYGLVSCNFTPCQ